MEMHAIIFSVISDIAVPQIYFQGTSRLDQKMGTWPSQLADKVAKNQKAWIHNK